MKESLVHKYLLLVKFNDFLIRHIRYFLCIFIPPHISNTKRRWNYKYNPTEKHRPHQVSKPIRVWRIAKKVEYYHNNKKKYPYIKKKSCNFFNSIKLHIVFIHVNSLITTFISYLFFILCSTEHKTPLFVKKYSRGVYFN